MAEKDEFGDILDDSSEDTEEKSQEETSGAAEETKGEESGSGNDERVRTLQSRADKAEAEANKLRKQLKSQESNATGSEPAVPPQVAEWITAAEGRMRDQLYAEDARFSEYGISADRITGETPAEMRASAKELSKSIDTMEAAIRNKVQVEHGIAPPPSAGPPDKKVSFDKMSSDEFNAYVEKALKG